MGDGSKVVSPGDQVREEELDPSGLLVGGGASAPQGDLKSEAHREVSGAEGVVSHEGLAGGEALVGVVGHSEVGVVGAFEHIGGVVLVVRGGARAVDGHEYEGVRGNGLNIGDVVGCSDEGGFGAQQVGDGGRGVVIRRDGTEGEVGVA